MTERYRELSLALYHAVKEYLWLDAAGGFGQPMRVHKAKGNMIEAHDTLAEYLVRYQETMNLSDCICGPAPSPLMNCPVHGATCTACGEVWAAVWVHENVGTEPE